MKVGIVHTIFKNELLCCIMYFITLINQSKQLEQSCSKYQLTIENKTRIIIEIKKQLAVPTDKLKNLNKSLQDAQDSIRILRDKKLYLIQEKSQLEGQFKQLQASL